jgi:hypothetical protein
MTKPACETIAPADLALHEINRLDMQLRVLRELLADLQAKYDEAFEAFLIAYQGKPDA